MSDAIDVQHLIEMISPQERKQLEPCPVRVLQIVENLNNQAVESWLLKVLRVSVKEHPHVHWTFFCIVGKPGHLDDAVRQLGAQIIYSPHEVGSKRAFLSSLRSVMKQGGYDILHCHQDIMSALPLLASIGLPFRQRIVHVHNTSIALPTSNQFKTALMQAPFRTICLQADQVVGVSQDALDAMLGGRPRKAGRDQVIHCGIEAQRFKRNETRLTEVREELGFGPHAKILLFVGRMIAYKNPCFVIEMLSYLHQSDSCFAAVFAGSGPKEQETRELVRQKGLLDRVKVLGWRQDVPELMQSCDLLVWPGVEEPKEGLGLGVVEAQAAGLPVLMSRNVPEEAVVVPELVDIIPLELGAQRWADAVVKIFSRTRVDKQDALQKVGKSSFAIEHSAEQVLALYKN